MPRGERFGPGLIHVVAARRLAPDDLLCPLDGVGVIDPLAAVADSEHGPEVVPVGIPFGLLILTSIAEPVVKAVLSAVIITFSVYRLVGRSRWELEDDRLAWLFGFGAGVPGGAYGMNGPPAVGYGTLRRWSPERFRATWQGYFLPAS
jgi:hypothetical protein